ncbi:MAG: c-type cytochrome biogenesis protein CcmI [Piscinibacter sp.]|uniref:c-type cytochrome biogenesis protein CcmI n=1 Tax=Piscinibacter sp. TaxID=1903157 RepID=UPI003D12CB25
MMVFWTVVAMLLGGALLMLLPPLWRGVRTAAETVSPEAANLAVYRDQWREAEADLGEGLLAPERLAEARDDIQRRWLEEAEGEGANAEAPGAAPPRFSRGSAIALAVLLPLASVLTYLQLGDLRPLQANDPPPAVAAGAQHSLTPGQIEARVAALAERLKAAPGDAEGWVMLGRSYVVLGRYRDAAMAWRRAVELRAPDATLLADLADVVAMAQGKRLAGEPAALVQRALDADPRHVKALALAGSVAFEARDYPAARGYWERLLAVVPAQSDVARSIQGSIAQAMKMEAALGGGAASATAAAPLTGEVSLSPELAARVAAGDTLFVFARAAEGSRMPLAILRQPVGTWPQRFVLSDALAMSPNQRLSSQAQVVVGARISRSGNATPQPGDLVGSSAAVSSSAQGLRLVIDQVQP